MSKVLRFVFLILLLASPATAYRFAAWVPAWDSASLDSIQRNAGNLHESNPVWYALTADGSIQALWNAENPAWRAAMVGTRLLPTIQNYVNGRFDGVLVANLIATPQSRQQHAEAIVRLAVAQAYDGIDLDYEAIPATARDHFSEFVELLAAELHRAGKELSVTVHAKTKDSQTWKGPGGQDWARIGKAADSVKVMGYDYHWSTSAPGPLAPLEWLVQIADYAKSKMPLSKVMIGLPWYGYDWASGKGSGVTWRKAMDLAAAHGAPITRDSNGEATFSYADHQVFFQDSESYRRKVDAVIAKHPGIGGFTHWRTGAEDPAVWQKIAELRGTGGSGGSAARADFSIAGPGSFTAEAGRSAQAEFSLIAINNYTATTSVSVQPVGSFAGQFAIDRQQIVPGQNVRLTVAPVINAPGGRYGLDLQFSGGGVTRVMRVSVEVTPTPLTLATDLRIVGDVALRTTAGNEARGAFKLLGAAPGLADLSVTAVDPLPGTLRLTATRTGVGQTFELVAGADRRARSGQYRVRITARGAQSSAESIVILTISGRGRPASR